MLKESTEGVAEISELINQALDCFAGVELATVMSTEIRIVNAG